MVRVESDGVAKVQNLQDRIREKIEAEILDGVRAPGSAIDEKALAIEFNTSRTPVREALIVLSVRGLVTIVPRSGIYVRKANMSELVSALEAMAELEAVVAGFAAMRATEVYIKAMRRALQEGELAAQQENMDDYREANARLHQAIHRAGANPILAEQIRHTRHMLMGYRHRSFEMPGRLKVSIKEHAAIVQAICEGNVEGAKSAMRAHIQRGAEAMIALLRSATDVEPR